MTTKAEHAAQTRAKAEERAEAKAEHTAHAAEVKAEHAAKAEERAEARAEAKAEAKTAAATKKALTYAEDGDAGPRLIVHDGRQLGASAVVPDKGDPYIPLPLLPAKVAEILDDADAPSITLLLEDTSHFTVSYA